MNAIIMAAGTSSRFVPLSHECPKGLLNVKGEILIERQIRQLNEAGINDITVVVGYKSEIFSYLHDKFNVELVMNEDYARYNNTSSLIRVIDRLDNTFICCSDNYFPENVFKASHTRGYYSALFADGDTNEYCITTNTNDEITQVSIGGSNSWYMVGHVFFDSAFSKAFSKMMIDEYSKEETRLGYWEDVYIKHIEQLPPLQINRYRTGEIEEFDSLDELRLFDNSYVTDTRSSTIKDISQRLHVNEAEIHSFKNIRHNNNTLHFSFIAKDVFYEYNNGRIYTI